MYKDINVNELKDKIFNREEVVLLDVRTKEEYEQGHLENSILVPYDELEKRHKELNIDTDLMVVIYCRSGRRSLIAASMLERLGYKNLFNVLGGIVEWEKNGYPVSK